MYSAKEKAGILLKTEIFQHIPQEVLLEIAKVMEEMHIPKGHELIRKGEIGDSLYVLCKGKAKVHEEGIIFSELFPIDIFCELSLLISEPRWGSITTLEDSVMLSLSQEAFEVIMEDNADCYKGIIKILVKRIQAQNKFLTDYFRAKL
jgi:CRP/FNR family transcriptional regulator, cyclic AMP receptor protein